MSTQGCSECQEPPDYQLSGFLCSDFCQDPVLTIMKMRCIYRENFIKMPENLEHLFETEISVHKWSYLFPNRFTSKF